MHPDLNQHSRFDVWAWIMMGAGLGFIIMLVLLTNEGIFFSGDAGLKFLMVRQMEMGGSFSRLEAVKEPWVTGIWNAGFFPFGEPFVYLDPGGSVVAFPPAFQLVSVPFYRLMGYRGLYILPACSVVFLWISFWHFIRGFHIPGGVRLSLLAALIFASPLTVYGGLFWEHSIAVALGFFGTGFIAGRARWALVAGFVFGLSVWLRPEMLIFCGLAMLSQVVSIDKKSLRFILGAVVSIFAFLLFNYRLYGHLLGAHALQFLSNKGTAVFKPSVIELFTHLNGRLVVFFPSSLLLLAVMYLILKRRVISIPVLQLTLIITCFLWIIPFFLPNAGGKQWGARYLLPVVPAMLAVYAMVYSEISNRKTEVVSASFKRAVKFIFIANLVAGFAINVGWAYVHIRNDYENRVAPALAWIHPDESSAVIVQNQYITQEMVGAFETKNFFVAENEQRLAVLLHKLKQAGVRKIVYLSYAEGPGVNPKALRAGFISSAKKGNYLIVQCEISKNLK